MAPPTSTTTTGAPPTRFPLPDARRLRTWLLRLPLATRLLLLALLAFHAATLYNPIVTQWGALIPDSTTLSTLYRLNTFPLLHKSLPHLLLNTLTLLPLLERFETTHGTLTTLLLFTGPFGTLPGGLYTLLERYLLRRNSAALGASIWVFLLLAHESIKQWRAHPFFALPNNTHVPTWVSPLVLICITSFLVPHTSFLGHLCGAGTGYLWGLGWIRFLAPSERILRWIEGKLDLLGRIPHYVSVDQKVYGRYGVLPTTAGTGVGGGGGGRVGTGLGNGVPLGPVGSPRLAGG